jgi:dipeptidyl aminopeptidase/acylaminoacyl peptidase
MPQRRAITVEDLWRIERVGAPSLAPDGTRCVAAVTAFDMEANGSRSKLWLLSTTGQAPRVLTQGGEKDGAPRFSPRGDLVVFTSRRDWQGTKDSTPQLYLIAADGGEAERVAEVATGVDAFRWFPEGRRIAFVSWVWPDTKGTKAQAKRLAKWNARKESALITEETQYRHWDHTLPPGRVARLHLLTLARKGRPAKVQDLFEGTGFELPRADPDADAFDVSPDGRRIVFAFDPAAEKRFDHPLALAEIELDSGRITVLCAPEGWDCRTPRYAPDGQRIAFVASHTAKKITMPGQLAVWQRASGTHEVVSAEWDHDVHGPLAWEADGQALLLFAEQRGRRHLWRFDLPDRRAEVAAEGGWVQAHDKAAGTLVTLADSARHPPRLFVHAPGAAPRRLDGFNDELFARLDLGRVEERWIEGAEGDRVQVWLTHPPGFEPAKDQAPLLHLVHGGPHTAFGDGWHFRWNAHVFAAAGHVVACVNYHGSSGFGYAFLDSISHRFGPLEQHDIDAATDALLKEPWADPKRVFASGGSYGGFMAAWLNGHDTAGRYAAYVCHAGCFDWVGMFADDAYTGHARELGAWYWDDMGAIHAQSPHAAAGAMKTPTLVIHGALDYRVPDAQGLAYYNTLKARGVPARLVWFPDENHWVLKPRNSRLWYAEFLGWLARHDPGPRTARRKSRARAERH